MPDTCDRIECCFDVELIRKSFSTSIQIDICNSVLKFGVERSQYQLSLRDYTFGTKEYFGLNGFIKGE